MSVSVEDSTVSSSPRLTQRIGSGEGRYVLLSYHILCSHELPLVFFFTFRCRQLFFAITMDNQASRPSAPALVGDDHSNVVPLVMLPFLCEQLRSKQLALVEANDEMASLREEMIEKEAIIVDLTAQVALHIVQEEDLRAELTSLRTEHRAQWNQLNARLSAVEAKAAENKVKISALKARVDKLEAEIKAEIAELKAEREKNRAQIPAKVKAEVSVDKQMKEKIAEEVKEQVDNSLLAKIKELEAYNAKLKDDNQRLKSSQCMYRFLLGLKI